MGLVGLPVWIPCIDLIPQLNSSHVIFSTKLKYRDLKKLN